MTTHADDYAAPCAPRGLKAGGKRLWRAVTDEFELAELERIVTAEGVTHDSPQGVRAHPALVEARQQRIILAKLVASLRIPLDDDQNAGRLPQQRVGIRAVR